MTFSTRNFDPLTPISPQIPKFCNTNIAFSLETHCCRRHTCTCATKFSHHLGMGCCLPKTTFRTKIGGAALWKHPKNLGPPYVFLQPLKLATLNLVHNLGLGLAYQKTTFRTKIGGALARVTSKTNLGPLHIFATVEASNFKFGTQIGFGTSLPKMTFKTQVGGVWAKGASKNNLGPPTYFCNRWS